jgi:hypothetical protein
MMKKKLAAAVLALVFAMGTVGTAFAAKLECVVDAVDGDKVTMTCKDADKAKVGDKARVTTKSKGAVEGC